MPTTELSRKASNHSGGGTDDHVIHGFGTFGGVFTPCTLTILGVIMFLRFGEVVGTAGLWHALLIVLVAKSITVLTALSLSSIATNTRVQGGGAYFLISRSLGPESGGAIGIVFFLSQAIAVAMYVIGFTEALVAVAPGWEENFILVASLVNLAIFVCVFIGAGWTIKVQFIILAILGLAVGAFAIGAIQSFDGANLAANLDNAYTAHGSSVWLMFALFFPAVTGIMAGANMSGDLKDPARSIPRGTLAAIGVTAMIYLGMAVLLAGGATRADLLGPRGHMIVADISLWSPVIIAGIFAATLSSALGSMMGAPRILQALARDNIFPGLKWCAIGSRRRNEPRRAIVVSFVIAQLGILAGDLNAIAPIITMFFMITYGALNFATFSETATANPSYRPSFRLCPWWASLLGAISCLVMMVLIDWPWALAACLVMFSIHRLLTYRQISATWGDVKRGTAIERARRNLLILEEEDYHPKNWRPAILALGAITERRAHLAAYGRWLCGPSGLLFIAQVITSTDENQDWQMHERVERQLRLFIDKLDIDAFPAVVMAPNLRQGIRALVQSCGIGALRPNLLLFGWTDDPIRRYGQLAILRNVAQMKRSMVLLRHAGDPEDLEVVPAGTIDVWWLGLDNGGLMLLLAHLLASSPAWRGRPIRLLRMLRNDAGRGETVAHLEDLSRQARIPAHCEVIIGEDFAATLKTACTDSALVILGFKVLADDDQTLERLAAFAIDLPRVLFVNSAGDMNLEA